MSLKLDGIDLNSEAVPAEGNHETNLDKRGVNETPTYNIGDPGGFSVDGPRVLGEVNDSSITCGFVDEGLKAETEGVNRDESLEVEMQGNNGESDPKEGYSGREGGAFGKETATNDGKLDVEVKGIDNNEVEEKIDTDQTEELGVCEFPEHGGKGDHISLVVDLNSRYQDEVCIQSAEGTEGFIEVNLPFSVHLPGNSDASINDSEFTRNRHTPIKEALTSGELNEVDRKDAKSGALIPKSRGEENQTEKEGEFYVSDLVWGKVRSHPWWPGQITEPSAASEKAMKYFKKDSYLIAYFGDQTFAWNEASKIKPFRMYFSQMKKQSNVDVFCDAVDCALDEVSRRVEFGLACGCLPGEVSAKVKSQGVLNAGILEESTTIYGGDSFSTAASFIPAKLVNYLEAVATSPHNDIDFLEFTIARAQLLAFNRWKGYSQLPVLEELNGILGNDVDLPAVQDEKNIDEVNEDDLGSKEDNQIEFLERMSPPRGDSPMGRYLQMSNERKREKKRHLWDLMSGSSSSFPNGEYEDKGKASNEKTSASSRKKRKAVDSVSSPSNKRTRKGISMQRSRNTTSLLGNYTEVGDHIYGVAEKLDGSGVPSLNSGSGISHGAVVNYGRKSTKTSSSGASHLIAEKSRARRAIPREYPPVNEIFSKLCLAAESPMEGYSSVTPVAGFFCDFRNSICLGRDNSKKSAKSLGKQIVEKLSELETTEAFEFKGMEDSYWTDRIIQSNLDDQVLFEPETPSEKDIVIAEQEGLDGTNLILDNQHETNPVVTELELEDPLPLHPMDENSDEYSPTTLILNFTDLESVPSITNLNNIFNRYGPLEESQTKVLSKSKRAKVVFKRRPDAETAFSSAGKFSIFGPSLVSYRLKYTPPPRKASSTSKTKRRRKNATSGEDSAM